MEYIDGYRRSELKAARIKRRLLTTARLASAKRIAPMAALGAGVVLLFVIFILAFRFLDHLPAILILIVSYLFVTLSARTLLHSLTPWVERICERQVLLRLVRAYVRMLLFDAYQQREEALLAADVRFSADAREYAETLVLTFSEREIFLSGRAFEATVVGIVERYVGYMEALLSGEAEEIFELRARLRDEMDAWRKENLPFYAAEQAALIEDNLSLILRQTVDRREAYRNNRSSRLITSLLEGALLYPASGAALPKTKKLRIPPREEYERYCADVEELQLCEHGGLAHSLDKENRGHYRSLIDACRAFRLAYTDEGCPAIDLDRCEKKYRDSLLDDERCWACEKKFHARYRSLCPRCNHYVCPKCGQCYCGKYIMRHGTTPPTLHR